MSTRWHYLRTMLNGDGKKRRKQGGILKAKTRERLVAKLDARETAARVNACTCRMGETASRSGHRVTPYTAPELHPAGCPLGDRVEKQASEAEAKRIGEERARAVLAKVEPKEDAVLFAMRLELRAQLDTPLTGRSLFLLEQTASLARQLFALRTAPDGLAKLRGKTMIGGGGIAMSSNGFAANPLYAPSPYVMSSGDMGEMGDSLGVTEGIPMPGALATAPGVETFGATAIRELIGTATKKKEEPLSDLIADITQAERHGERDIAAALREKIRIRLGGSEPFAAPERRVAKMAKRKAVRRRVYDKPAPPPKRTTVKVRP